MHILVVADGRSPTTRSYIQSLQSLGYLVSLASTFPTTELPGLHAFEVFPIVFARFAGSQTGASTSRSARSTVQQLKHAFRVLLAPIRYNLGPLTIRFYTQRYLSFLSRLQPNLVHALRIPFEGMLASLTPEQVPLVVSTWGNDLTLHADRSPAMRWGTRRTLKRANGFIADTQRDGRLGRQWGFDAAKPLLVVPASGGLELDRIDRPRPHLLEDLPRKLGEKTPLVINPRGFRPGSVRNDTFFQAIPLVLEKMPDVQFACSAMQGQPEALAWVNQLGIAAQTLLLPTLPQETLWETFKLAQVTASISQHDGTPGSLLEAMACGCFPVAGDIESLREWITPGENGLLVDPADPKETASALLQALQNKELRQQAAQKNRQILEQRATTGVVREKIRAFYSLFGN